MGSMKVHQLSRGFWERQPSLSLGCKPLRPLALKLPDSDDSTITTNTVTSLDLKSFIRPDSGPIKLVSGHKKDPPQPQVETQAGGTRWNPTQEQIGILEMLYKGGMRTPNAQQIERITAQLGKYGKIEGKNVFYWFQNHKARERQKQKRNNLGLSHSPRTPPPPISTTMSLDIRIPGEMVKRDEDSPYKRECRRWSFDSFEVRKSWRNGSDDNNNNTSNEDKTLELFPLQPEG